MVGGPTTPAILAEQDIELNPESRYFEFNSAETVYEDEVENYVTSEPSLDYTAASLFLVAVVGVQ